MKKIFLQCLLTCIVGSIMAQGRVGINTTTPTAMLHVKDSSVVFTGVNAIFLPASPGNPPVSGPGARMMWYPDKAAFRAGLVTSTYWDKDSIGLYSFGVGGNPLATGDFSMALGDAAYASGTNSLATGFLTIASGQASTAMGRATTASGNYSVAAGYSCRAVGDYSTAFGFSARANGDYSTASGNTSHANGFASTAIGQANIAEGDYSTALGNTTAANGLASSSMGLGSVANGYASTVIGLYNDSIVAAQASPLSTTPLFIIGNGFSTTDRSNAITVLRSGNTGINVKAPLRPLHVSGTVTTTGITPNTDAVIVVEKDNDNAYINLLTDTDQTSGILFGNQNNTADGGIFYNTNGNTYDLRLRTNGNATRMTIDSIGNVGIGTTAPSQRLHVSGNICATGTIGACSDIRYKKDLAPIDHSLSSILSLHGLYYHWRKDEYPEMQFNNDRQMGFSAQEVEKLFPEMVMTDVHGYKSVDYGRLTPVLVEAIKEEQQEIESLKKEIAAIKELLVQKNNSK